MVCFMIVCQKKTALHKPFMQLERLVEMVLRVAWFLFDVVQEDELGLPAVPRASLRS
jgi:hypothetical protein